MRHTLPANIAISPRVVSDARAVILDPEIAAASPASLRALALAVVATAIGRPIRQSGGLLAAGGR